MLVEFPVVFTTAHFKTLFINSTNQADIKAWQFLKERNLKSKMNKKRNSTSVPVPTGKKINSVSFCNKPILEKKNSKGTFIFVHRNRSAIYYDHCDADAFDSNMVTEIDDDYHFDLCRNNIERPL